MCTRYSEQGNLLVVGPHSIFCECAGHSPLARRDPLYPPPLCSQPRRLTLVTVSTGSLAHDFQSCSTERRHGERRTREENEGGYSFPWLPLHPATKALPLMRAILLHVPVLTLFLCPSRPRGEKSSSSLCSKPLPPTRGGCILAGFLCVRARCWELVMVLGDFGLSVPSVLPGQ